MTLIEALLELSRGESCDFKLGQDAVDEIQRLEAEYEFLMECVKQLEHENDQLRSRLDSIRAKCEAAATAPVGTDYPYGDGYRAAAQHILGLAGEGRET